MPGDQQGKGRAVALSGGGGEGLVGRVHQHHDKSDARAAAILMRIGKDFQTVHKTALSRNAGKGARPSDLFADQKIRPS